MKQKRNYFDAMTERANAAKPLQPATLIDTTKAFADAADNGMQRNIDFVEHVTTRGQTIYDGYGTPVHHTTDLELVGEVLEATGDRHFGVHMTGLRPV